MSDFAEAPSARETEQRCKIVETAGRLFREIGFQKTTVVDIARALGMSPANVYRFFGAKSEITQAVARQLMSEVELHLSAIADAAEPAADRLRAMVLANERMNRERYIADRKLHDMVEAALGENWPIIDEHISRIDAILAQVIASGMASGEFAKGDAEMAARLMHTACIRYCHPRLLVECADRPEPTAERMVAFCLRALGAG